MGETTERKIPTALFVWIAVIVLGVGISAALIYQFIDDQRAQNLREWQVRLGIVADSRRADVDRWLEQQYSVLDELRQNSSLQFYAMDIIAAREEGIADFTASEDAIAEIRYLQNLLTVTAERAGFEGDAVGAVVEANVSRTGVAGLAVLDNNGEVIVATREMPPIAGQVAEQIAQIPRAQRGLIDIHVGVSGVPTMGFAVPVFAVQGNAVASDQVGMVVGIKEVAPELFPLLKQPGAVEATVEALLVRKGGSVVEYLSPLKDGTPALGNSLAANTADLAAAYAIDTPGGFGEKVDYRNQRVLVTSRLLAVAPWTLLYKIDRSEALAASEQRLRTMLIVSVIVLCFFVAVILAVWKYGASIRAEKAMASYRSTSQQFENILKFMRLLADSQPAEIFAVSGDGNYTFANMTAANAAGTRPQDMKGKSMTSIIGPVKARVFSEVNEAVIDNFEKAEKVYRFEENNAVQIVRASHLPLRADDNYPAGALVVADDITAFVAETEARQNGMRQLSRALIFLLDQRDPYSAIHAAMVAKIGVMVADELGLDDDVKLTVDLAGNLVNLGKAFVSRDLLVSDEKLTHEERSQIRQHMMVAADLVKSVEFGVPVVDTLRQLQEHWDGSGVPAGLKGDDILISARIVGTTHAIVGMLSPRPHRPPMDYQDAIKHMQDYGEGILGPRVFPALVHVLENRGGREVIGLTSHLDGRIPSPEEAIALIEDISDK